MNLLLDQPEYFCPFCLDQSASLKFDKHGRPYLVCVACHARAFFKTRASLLGLVVLPDFIATLNKQAQQDPGLVAELQQRLDGFIQDLQRRAAGPAPARESGETAVPLPAAEEKVA